jgi:MerR family regulatory protein
MTGRLDDLDDPDYPAYTTGRAAEVLGVQPAFLRALDAAGAVTPERTPGGRRRYTAASSPSPPGSGSCSTRATPWPPRGGSWLWKTTWPPSGR